MTPLSPDQHAAPPAGAPDPGMIFELCTAYWASAAMLAANSLGVFSAVGNGGRPVEEVAAAIAAKPRSVEMLLDACCGLGLLVKRGRMYELTPTSAAFLVPGRPGYLGSALRWSQDQYRAWGRLPDAVRTGQPVVPPGQHLGDDPEQTRSFVLAMHERALGVARGVIGFIDLDGCKTLLDVGGGPGTYAALLARKHPTLRADVLDLPGVVPIARELIAEACLGDRVRVVPGDATSGEYGHEAYDAVLFCGVLHQMSPRTIRQMLAGAHRALVPGGRVIVSDLLLAESKTEPLLCALFSLQMLLTTQEGAAFSATECVDWLQGAGFAHAQTRRLPPPLPYTVVSALK